MFADGPERKSELPLFPIEPLDGADDCGADDCGSDVCGAASGELAGWVVAAGGGLRGEEVLASSKAANGCEAVSWLDVDGCIRGGVSETAVDRSGAILDILDTRELLKSGVDPGGLLATSGPVGDNCRTPWESKTYAVLREVTDGSLFVVPANFAVCGPQRSMRRPWRSAAAAHIMKNNKGGGSVAGRESPHDVEHT